MSSPYPPPGPPSYDGTPTSPDGAPGRAYPRTHLQVAPPATTTMAKWALAAACAFCVPLAPLVAIVLAIVVLVRSRDGREHGRGLAIAALAIGSVTTLVQGISVVTNVVEAIEEQQRLERNESASGRPLEEPSDVPVFRLEVGDCFDDPALLAADGEEIETSTVRIVPCSQAHLLEVFEIIRVAGEEWPGDRAVQEASEACFPAFAEFNRRPYAQSDLEVFQYYPQERSWELLGDRTITCAVNDPSGDSQAGTLKFSRR